MQKVHIHLLDPCESLPSVLILAFILQPFPSAISLFQLSAFRFQLFSISAFPPSLSSLSSPSSL